MGNGGISYESTETRRAHIGCRHTTRNARSSVYPVDVFQRSGSCGAATDSYVLEAGGLVTIDRVWAEWDEPWSSSYTSPENAIGKMNKAM